MWELLPNIMDTSKEVFAVIGASGLISALTPQRVQKINVVFSSLYAIINLIGANFGGAKNK